MKLLCKGFNDYKDIVKNAIVDLSIQYKADIINNEYDITLELLDCLIKTDKLTNALKHQFFVLILPKINEEQCINYLNILGLENFDKLFTRGRPKFKITEINKKILDEFKNKRWITKYDEIEEENGSSYYRAYGRNLSNTLPNELL